MDTEGGFVSKQYKIKTKHLAKWRIHISKIYAKLCQPGEDSIKTPKNRLH